MDQAKLISAIDAATKKATELGATVSVAIVDEAGILLAFYRMDGAIKASPTFSIAKAYTSGTLGLSTADIAKYSGEGKPYYGVETLSAGKMTTIAGGFPIMQNNKLIGGIGVGGSHDVNQDVEIAQAALDILK